MQSKKLHSFRFQERFARVLKDRGVTQGQLAADTGISQAALSNYLRGARAVPRVEELAALARYFGTSMEWLLGIEEAAKELASHATVPAGDGLVPLDRRKLSALAKQLRVKVDQLDRLCGKDPSPDQDQVPAGA